MSELSNETQKALLFVKRKKIVPLCEIPFELSRLDSLMEKNYVRKISIPPKQYPDGYTEYYGIQITADGKDALSLKHSSTIQARIALILSIVALSISFFDAFTPFSDMLRAWITSLFT